MKMIDVGATEKTERVAVARGCERRGRLRSLAQGDLGQGSRRSADRDERIRVGHQGVPGVRQTSGEDQDWLWRGGYDALAPTVPGDSCRWSGSSHCANAFAASCQPRRIVPSRSRHARGHCAGPSDRNGHVRRPTISTRRLGDERSEQLRPMRRSVSDIGSWWTDLFTRRRRSSLDDLDRIEPTARGTRNRMSWLVLLALLCLALPGCSLLKLKQESRDFHSSTVLVGRISTAAPWDKPVVVAAYAKSGDRIADRKSTH